MYKLDDIYDDVKDMKEEFDDNLIIKDMNNILSILDDIKDDVVKFNNNNYEIGELLDEEN